MSWISNIIWYVRITIRFLLHGFWLATSKAKKNILGYGEQLLFGNSELSMLVMMGIFASDKMIFRFEKYPLYFQDSLSVQMNIAYKELSWSTYMLSLVKYLCIELLWGIIYIVFAFEITQLKPRLLITPEAMAATAMALTSFVHNDPGLHWLTTNDNEAM